MATKLSPIKAAHSVSQAIISLMNNGKISEAEVVFRNILNPTYIEYTTIISSYLRVGLIDKAATMADQLREFDYIDPQALCVLMSVECARLDFPQALSILEVIKARRDSPEYLNDLSVGYTTLIYHVGLSDPARARQFYEQIKDESTHLVDISMINGIMSVHVKIQDWPRVIDYYNEAKDLGLEPDLITKNILIYANIELGNIDL